MIYLLTVVLGIAGILFIELKIRQKALRTILNILVVIAICYACMSFGIKVGCMISENKYAMSMYSLVDELKRAEANESEELLRKKMKIVENFHLQKGVKTEFSIQMLINEIMSEGTEESSECSEGGGRAQRGVRSTRAGSR